ncbi:MAG TPA: PAS domain S-box protein [Armatimonadota bacterium]|nr:PAS domain S-box protein [Armatimonadota bacterium]
MAKSIEMLLSEPDVFAEFAEQIPCGVCTLEVPSLRIRTVNPAFAALADIPDARTLPGKLPAELPDTPLLRHLQPLWEQIAAADADTKRISLAVAGTPPLLLTGIPLRAPDGAIGALLVVAQEDVEPYRQEAATLHREHDFLTAILNTTETLVIALDLRGTILSFNRACEKLTGYTAAEVVGKPVWDILLLPEEKEKVRRALASLSAEQPRNENENHLRTRDGALRYIEWTNAAMLDAQNQLSYILSTGIDITERKHIEEALRESEALYRAVFENTGAATCIIEEDTTIVLANTEFERLSGYAKWEFEGKKNFLYFVHPDDMERLKHYNSLRRKHSPAAPRNYEFRFVNRVGSINTIYTTIAPIPGTNRYVVSFTDITDRKRDEETRRFLLDVSSVLTSSLDYQTTLDRLAHLVVPSLADWCIIDVVAEDGSIQRVATAHADPACEDLIHQLHQYPPLPDSPGGVALALRTGQPVYNPVISESDIRSFARNEEHLRLLQRLGSHSSIILPLVARGRTLGAITLVFSASDRHHTPQDLTLAELVALRAALAVDNARLYRIAQEANAAKDQFLAVLSHELRNPLAPILAGTEILRRTIPADERAQRTVEIITRNAKLQARLVNDLLDLSRLTRGKIQLVMEPVALDKVVRSAIEAYQAELEASGLSLRTALQNDLWVQGDFDRLQQVVMNLLSNAIKFTPRGGEISVSLRRKTEQPAAEIVIADTGAGIEPDLLPKLFTMFQQGKTGPERKTGLGIGLALARSFTEMHGGQIRATSEGQGKGSCFTVELPLIAPPQAVTSEEPATGGEYRACVLLVEDNPDTRALLAEGLTLMGYTVHSTATAEEALQLLPQVRPAVILSDIGLPGMDGYEFLQRARRIPGLPPLIAFALTGYGQEADQKRAHDAGYVAHFIKPVDLAEVDRRIRELLPSAVQQSVPA